MGARVFKIDGKFQDYGLYSKLTADFKGYFVMEDASQEIKGYLIDQHTLYNPIRYIYGMYNEDLNKLVYLELTNDRLRSPLLYVFPNLKEEGVWTNYSIMTYDFFPYGNINGKARIAVTEIIKSSNEFSDEILKKYNEVLEIGEKLNMMLIEKGVEQYMSYVID